MQTELNILTDKVIGAAIRIHKALGPGLLESAYEACMAYELSKLGMQFELQKPMPVKYEGVCLDCGYRIDILVEKEVVVELKAVEKIHAIHEAQVISYLRMSGCKLGLIINLT